MTYVYKRKAHYHETDQMGIVHHSNYIKWFEEARIFLMDTLGFSYKAMEEAGVLSPVTSVSAQYKQMVRFDDTVSIHVHMDTYTGVRYEISYKITDETGEILYTTGTSSHCFIKTEGGLVSLKKKYPDIHKQFEAMLAHKEIVRSQ